MVRWFLVLLIALLPLRGWVGEAMAGQMLQQQLAELSHSAPAPSAHRTPAFTHDDCLGHGEAAERAAQAQAAAAERPDPAFHAGCLTCAACQVCSAVALLALPAAATGSAELPQAVPQSRAWTVASAEPAGVFKPPIS